jgi:hypothetical protein
MTIYASYSHPIFLATPLHCLTAAVFAAIALILIVGTAIELVHILRTHRRRS